MIFQVVILFLVRARTSFLLCPNLAIIGIVHASFYFKCSGFQVGETCAHDCVVINLHTYN